MRSFLFILALIVIVAGGLYLSRNKNPFSNASETKLRKPNTKFKPEELAVLATNCNPDFIAGECNSKGFTFFLSNWPLPNNQKSHVYRHYFIGEDADPLYRSSKEACEQYMEEKISIWENEKSFFYTIKDKGKYNEFISYLASIKQETPAPLNNIKDFNPNSSYVIQDCVFFANGYSIDLNGFSICIMPLKEYLKYPKESGK